MKNKSLVIFQIENLHWFICVWLLTWIRSSSQVSMTQSSSLSSSNAQLPSIIPTNIPNSCNPNEEGSCSSACINQVRYDNVCYFKRNFGKLCHSKEMCKTKNALCLDSKRNEVVYRPNASVFKSGHCMCDHTDIYVQATDECRLSEPPCENDSDCGNNFQCRAKVCICRFEYHQDHRKYLSLCVHNETMYTICPPGVPSHSKSCLPYFKRSEWSPGMEPNWTLTLWKLLVLSSILVSLLLLARRIKRAQRYDERIRSMYFQREAVRREFMYSNTRRGNGLGDNTNTVSNVSVDLPPTYDEAIKQQVILQQQQSSQSTSGPMAVQTTATVTPNTNNTNNNNSSSV